MSFKVSLALFMDGGIITFTTEYLELSSHRLTKDARWIVVQVPNSQEILSGKFAIICRADGRKSAKGSLA